MKGTEVALQNPKEQVDRDAKERGDSFRKGGHVQRKRRASGGALSEAHALKSREGGGETHQGALRRGGRATGRKK